MRNQDTAIWTRVTLPEDAKWTGKTIRLPATISVKRQHSTGIFGFEDREAEFVNEFQLHLSTPLAAAIYYALWFYGLLSGGGLIVLSGFILRKVQLHRMRNSMPPRTMNLERCP